MSDLVPLPDEESQPFFEGAASGRLMLQRCERCGTYTVPVRSRCIACGARAMRWVQASGKGRVYSHSRVSVPLHPELAARLPYTAAVIDLDEGVRLTSELVGVDDREPTAGMAVEAIFVPAGDGVTLPKFRPAADA